MSTTTKNNPPAEEIARFLDQSGSDFLWWQDGCIVMESYFDKQFRALGGDTNLLISLFEDYGTMEEASRQYLENPPATKECPINRGNTTTPTSNRKVKAKSVT